MRIRSKSNQVIIKAHWCVNGLPKAEGIPACHGNPKVSMIGFRCTLSGLLHALAAYVTHGEAYPQDLFGG